jgi:hypothetical protein
MIKNLTIKDVERLGEGMLAAVALSITLVTLRFVILGQ